MKLRPVIASHLSCDTISRSFASRHWHDVIMAFNNFLINVLAEYSKYEVINAKGTTQLLEVWRDVPNPRPRIF